MRPVHATPVIFAIAFLAIGCNKEQRATADSAAGNVANEVRAALSVIDIDMGRHVDTARNISDKTDDFAPKDTIFASLHTSGTANNSPVNVRWTYQDSIVVDEQTQNVTTDGDAKTAFYIVKPTGFSKGKYTIHVTIDGKEVRTKDVTVK